MKGSKAQDKSQCDANKEFYDSLLFTVFRGLIMLHGLVDLLVANHDNDQWYRIACACPKEVETDLPLLQGVLVIA